MPEEQYWSLESLLIQSLSSCTKLVSQEIQKVTTRRQDSEYTSPTRSKLPTKILRWSQKKFGVARASQIKAKKATSLAQLNCTIDKITLQLERRLLLCGCRSILLREVAGEFIGFFFNWGKMLRKMLWSLLLLIVAWLVVPARSGLTITKPELQKAVESLSTMLHNIRNEGLGIDDLEVGDFHSHSIARAFL